MKQQFRTIKAAEDETYATVYTAAAETGLSSWTWRRKCYSGEVASVKAGTRLLIPRSEIRRFMAAGYRPATVDASGR